MKILKLEMRTPALTAAACAAVLLLASPVSAATAQQAAEARLAFRAIAQERCEWDTKTGMDKGRAAECVQSQMNGVRQEAADAVQECLDGGGSRPLCQEEGYDVWVEKAGT